MTVFGMKTTMKPTQGFTLIEIMIAVAIIAIISGFAYPSYVKHVQRAKRVDAQTAVLEAAQRQEAYSLRMAIKCMSNCYANSLAQLEYKTTSSEGLYNLALSATPSGCTGNSTPPVCDGFEITATPVTTKPQAQDSECQSLTVNQLGTKSAKDANNSASTKCW